MVTSQSQPTVVVTSHLPVVSVGSLTPTQLAQTLVKQAGGSKTVTQAVGGTSGTTGLPTSRLTPQQINILKQQALMRKKNENNKQLQGINQASVSAGSAVAAGKFYNLVLAESILILIRLTSRRPFQDWEYKHSD